MPPILRVFAVVGVLGAGLGLASLFQRTPEPATLVGQPRWAVRPDAPQVVLGPAKSVFGLAPPGPSDIAPPTVAMTEGTLSGPGSADPFEPPPMLPLRSPIGNASSRPASREPFMPSIADAPSRQLSRDLPAQDIDRRDAAATIKHRIVDGDTLESLAERYLQDRARWSDIFHHNRDQLTAPGALPIGVELRIPSRDAAAFLPSEPPMVPL